MTLAFLKNLAKIIGAGLLLILAVASLIALLCAPAFVADQFGMGWGVAMFVAYLLGIALRLAWDETRANR